MRSPREISFRLRQEAGNLALFAAPPSLPRASLESAAPRLAPLPDPGRVAAALRGTAFAAEVEALASSAASHVFPLVGLSVNTGPAIDWRRDYVHGISTGTPYFRLVPYLDFRRAGDHKIVWELNRHQHLVLLAQAFRLTGRREYLDEAFRQAESWMDANPFTRGINWASALEVAFRALSWMWLWHLASGEMPDHLRRRFLEGVYRHGCFLERNLSVYFSPNTHLLGEAVALEALGLLFPGFPRAERWARTGGGIVRAEIERQVRADGSHFEQSVYYHVYALDFFLLRAVLVNPGDDYRARLFRMAEYLAAVTGVSGDLPFIGDDDGGRLFHPHGERAGFGRATLATCGVLLGQPAWIASADDLHAQAAWWMGEGVLAAAPAASAAAPASRLFGDAGVAVMAAPDCRLVVKAGPLGEGSAGHSHADVLSVVARRGSREILIDPGTYTYVADPAERDRFRGTAAHNTVSIDGRDQAVAAGPFRWRDKPETGIRCWLSSSLRDFLDAWCSYAGFTHRRRMLFVKPELLAILDEVTGPEGPHSVAQQWHLASPAEAVRFSLSEPAALVDGWRSRAFACKEPAPVLRAARHGPLPVRMAAVVDLSDAPEAAALTISAAGDAAVLEWGGRGGMQLVFPAEGDVSVRGAH